MEKGSRVSFLLMHPVLVRDVVVIAVLVYHDAKPIEWGYETDNAAMISKRPRKAKQQSGYI